MTQWSFLQQHPIELAKKTPARYSSAPMIKTTFYLFLTFSFFSAAPNFYALEPVKSKDTISTAISELDDLITMTALSLSQQKELRILILKYQDAQKLCLDNPDDNDLMLQAAKAAHQVLENIQKNHLTQTFSPEFINELNLFDQVATKRWIPKP